MKAKRETIVLVAAAVAIAFALSFHARMSVPEPTSVATDAAHQEVWTGHLAAVAPPAAAAPAEPMSSASLVVPKSAMALPAPPRKVPAKAPASVPPPRNTQVASINPPPPVAVAAEPEHDRGLLHTLNPVNHLPDMATVRRPFAYAGETIAGWFRHF